jgi:hypothetical protein
MDQGFKTENLVKLLEKIDKDTNFNPTSVVAFGYHFESKNLRHPLGDFLNPALALPGQGLKKSPIGQKLDYTL